MPDRRRPIQDIESRLDKEFYRKLVDNLHDAVYFVDTSRTILFWNKAAERITGFMREEVVGHRCGENLLRHVDDEARQLCLVGCPLSRTLTDGKVREAEVYLHHKKGHRVPVFVRVSPVRDAEGRIAGAVELFGPISGRLGILEEIEDLRQQVYRDQLTGLGNRALAEAALARHHAALKESGVPFGLLFIDIDHFKRINDTFGHASGDEVLRMVARTLAGVLRGVDELCRWGGEEFLAVLPNVDLPTLHIVGNRLRALTSASWLEIGTARLRVTISVGGVLVDDPDVHLARQVDLADQAMYACKEAGRDKVCVKDYSPTGEPPKADQ
ncbi:MAG: diguanylate cyclase [Desulfovibrionaceae bacterium]